MPPSCERDQERVQEAGNVNKRRVSVHAGSLRALLCTVNSEPCAYSSACPWAGAVWELLSWHCPSKSPKHSSKRVGKASKACCAKVGLSQGQRTSIHPCVNSTVSKACWHCGSSLGSAGCKSPSCTRVPGQGACSPLGLGTLRVGWSLQEERVMPG